MIVLQDAIREKPEAVFVWRTPGRNQRWSSEGRRVDTRCAGAHTASSPQTPPLQNLRPDSASLLHSR